MPRPYGTKLKKRNPKTAAKRKKYRQAYYLAGLQGIQSAKERKKAAKWFYKAGRIPMRLLEQK